MPRSAKFQAKRRIGKLKKSGQWMSMPKSERLQLSRTGGYISDKRFQKKMALHGGQQGDQQGGQQGIDKQRREDAYQKWWDSPGARMLQDMLPPPGGNFMGSREQRSIGKLRRRLPEPSGPWGQSFEKKRINQLMGMLPEPSETFETSPGYDWRLGQGLQAIDRSAGARGTLRSGRTMKAAQEYGQDLASEEYQRWLRERYGYAEAVQGERNLQRQNWLARAYRHAGAMGGQEAGAYGDWYNRRFDRANRMVDEFNVYGNRLAAMAGLGQTAAFNTARAGVQSGTNLSNLMMQQGGAQASGVVGGMNALTSGFESAAGFLGDAFGRQTPWTNPDTGQVLTGGPLWPAGTASFATSPGTTTAAPLYPNNAF